MSDEHCELCRTIAEARAGTHFRKLQEFKHSILFAGPHQFFKGYCVLVAKEHVREPFELPEAAHTELMAVSRAIQSALHPWKLNYGCYGNQVPHVHWHLFPRYEGDPELKSVPWLAMPSDLGPHQTTQAQVQELRDRLHPWLSALPI